MKTVNIRDIRGETLRDTLRAGNLIAITKSGALIGVVIPVATAWIEHLIDYNWSHVRQSITEAEQAMASDTPVVPLDAITEQDRLIPERLVAPIIAAVVGGTVAQAPQSKQTLRQLQAALNPPRSAAEQEARPAEPSVRTVRIGEISARQIEKAGESGQALAVTHERELIGIVVPVTQGLVQLLIEQNMSRVLYNIGMAEKQLTTKDTLTTLGQLADQKAPSESGARSPF
jgi:antitoxin (DNA-binding transcriptional repressor) of toxin-antitoxin stability system